MTIADDFDYARLVDAVRTGRLIAFVGAGVSTTYVDDAGHQWKGLPTGSEVVEDLVASRRDISTGLRFDEACFMLKRSEGRPALEEFLVERFDKPTLDPSPAHQLLARLGFSAYITSNFDQLLEKAMREERRAFAPIVQDEDVSKLRASQVPIVKYHGCVSRPKSMVASMDEIARLGDKLPIVEALLKTLLANKTVLFLGFNLADEDFGSTFQELRQLLGDYMPRSYAVSLGVSPVQGALWESRGLQMIELDLTDFLRGLQRAAVREPHMVPTVYSRSDDYVRNRYFESLLRIRSQPTETMVIDAFLDHLLHELCSVTLEYTDIVEEARMSADLVLSNRPHFEALKKVRDEVFRDILDRVASKDEAEVSLKAYKRERETIADRIAHQGSVRVEKGDSLLLYSQSRRVVEFLRGTPQGTQAACQLFIAECRPKSPNAMQDALAFCEALNETKFEVTIIPDMAIGHVIQQRQVTKVVLGAHTVYAPDGEPTSFVNTCGSEMIAETASTHAVPVLVVAERIKISNASNPKMTFEQEERLFDPIDDEIRRLSTLDRSVKSLNIGYDLCLWRPGFVLVTDEPVS